MSTARASLIPARPVHQWIRNEIVPEFGSVEALSRVLAGHTCIKAKSWQRFFMRLAHRDYVDVYVVDALCVLLNAHIGRFDPVYSSMDS